MWAPPVVRGPPDQRLRHSPEEPGAGHLHPSACPPPGCTSQGSRRVLPPLAPQKTSAQRRAAPSCSRGARAQDLPPSLQTPHCSDPCEPVLAPLPAPCAWPCSAGLWPPPWDPRGHDPRAGAVFLLLLAPRKPTDFPEGAGLRASPPDRRHWLCRVVGLDGRWLRTLAQERPAGGQASSAPHVARRGQCPGAVCWGPGPSPCHCRLPACPACQPTSTRPSTLWPSWRPVSTYGMKSIQ